MILPRGQGVGAGNLVKCRRPGVAQQGLFRITQRSFALTLDRGGMRRTIALGRYPVDLGTAVGLFVLQLDETMAGVSGDTSACGLAPPAWALDPTAGPEHSAPARSPCGQPQFGVQS